MKRTDQIMSQMCIVIPLHGRVFFKIQMNSGFNFVKSLLKEFDEFIEFIENVSWFVNVIIYGNLSIINQIL